MSSPGPSKPVPVIALDGRSGSGKSTLARLLAERLGWSYLDSGAWYRALTWAALEHGADPASDAALLGLLSRIDIHSRADGAVVVDGRELREEIRSPRIDAAVSDVADHPAVRAALTERMRGLRARPGVAGVVADGRDAGAVIFPDADLKVFIDTEFDVRVARRFRQHLESHSESELAAVRAALEERDRRDAARGESAPRRLDGGQVVENTHISVEEAIRRLLDLAAPLLASSGAQS
jgi:cytidylate kinase